MFFGILGAMDSEVSSFKDLLEDVKEENYNGFSYIVGKRAGKDIVVTKSGVGKVNMAMAVTQLINHYDVDLIINTGIAGSYNTKINTTCVATEVRYHDVLNLPFTTTLVIPIYPKSELIEKSKNILSDCKFGTFLTGDQFVTKLEDLHGADLTNVVACDMESMAVARVAQAFNKDFLIIRTISDNLSLDAAEKNEEFTAFSAINSVLKFVDQY